MAQDLVASHSTESTRRALAGGDPRQRRELLLAYLVDEVARLSGTAPDRVDVNRSATALGLDSLAAAELCGSLEDGLGLSAELAAVLSDKSLAEVAAGLAEVGAGLAETAAGLAAPPPAQDELPLSAGQRGLWFVSRLAQARGIYHISAAASIAAPPAAPAEAGANRRRLDLPALGRALARLAVRHPVLRTTVAVREDGEPVQRLDPALEPKLLRRDARGRGAAAVRRLLEDEAVRPFDLEAGPLLRLVVIDLDGGAQALLLVIHHLIADFWSLAVLVRELGVLYQGECSGSTPPLGAPERGHADFVRRQQLRLAGPAGESLERAWRERLAGEPPPLDLPTDRARRPHGSFAGAILGRRAGRELAAAVRQLAARHETTPFVVLFAALSALLHRHGAGDEMLLGAPTAGRDDPALATAVGYFVNSVVLRAELSGDPTFAAHLAAARREALAALALREMPLPLLVERLAPRREAGRAPLFQALLSFLRAPAGAPPGLAWFALGQEDARLAWGGHVLSPLRLTRTVTELDLALHAAESEAAGGDLGFALHYRSELFEAATMVRLLAHLCHLLAAAAAAPETPVGSLSLLAAAERAQLLREWNDTAEDWRQALPATAALAAPAHRLAPAAARVQELFAWRAARQPEAAAVAGQGATLTYGELALRAERLARHLRRLGVGPDVRVAVCLERSPEMVVAVLAVLAAGGAYVPLDPLHPAARTALVLDDAAPAVVVTEERWLARLGLCPPPGERPDRRRRAVLVDRDRAAIAAEEGPAAGSPGDPAPENLAYLLYTSGSTGRPKGVAVPHRALLNLLRALAAQPGLGAADVMTALATLSFDIATLEIFLPLAVGGRVEVVSAAEAADGRLLAGRLAAAGVTALQATPASWRLLLDAGWGGAAAAPGTRFMALTGGEALPRRLAADLLGRGVELWNLYGPTETTIYSSRRRVAPRPA
ncbi:MAG TPA: condensation domain-containing protein, partial [Thermoanaerobaculia bacterium]|nr:condensation domain-containing protein [Thermoanaerobaculia bacterium]